MEDIEQFPQEERSSSKKKYLIIGTVAMVIIGGGSLWLALVKNGEETRQGDTAQETTQEFAQPFDEESLSQQKEIGTADWQTYRSEEVGFEFQYPSEASESQSVFEGGVVRFDLPREAGTNLSRKYVEIVASPASAQEECVAPHQAFTREQAQVQANGTQFLKRVGGGAGLGTYYETTSYSALRDGQCVSVVFGLDVGNLGNFKPESRPKEFNREEEEKAFDQILSTFRFVE